MGERILLIEDDAALGAQIVAHLRAAGLETTWLTDGARVFDGESFEVDLLVLDLMLPRVGGLDVLKRFRERSDVPVLILSARNDGETRVRGLEARGGRASSRSRSGRRSSSNGCARGCGGRASSAGRRSRAARSGSIFTRAASPCATCPFRSPPPSTRSSPDRARRRGARRSRARRSSISSTETRTAPTAPLDVHVSRVRKKLGEAGVEIVTVWGIGYRLGRQA